MQRFILELIAAISLTLAAIMAQANGASAADIMVTQAFARASATPAATSGAAYVSLTNFGPAPDRLVSIATPQAMSAEIHTTKTADGVVKMEAAGDIVIPPAGTLSMSPGGMHIMLMGLTQPLKKCETLDLTFVFEKAGELHVSMPVGGVAATGPAQADGGSGG